jgi:hypothetical protein
MECTCRFAELKALHGIEDEKPTSRMLGPQKMSSGLISNDLELIITDELGNNIADWFSMNELEFSLSCMQVLP